jgi:hypothetical protein
LQHSLTSSLTVLQKSRTHLKWPSDIPQVPAALARRVAAVWPRGGIATLDLGNFAAPAGRSTANRANYSPIAQTFVFTSGPVFRYVVLLGDEPRSRGKAESQTAGRAAFPFSLPRENSSRWRETYRYEQHGNCSRAVPCRAVPVNFVLW